MNSKAPVALAIGIGYLLGRKHKLRWALLLGGAAATGRFGGMSTQLLQRGGELLRSSPELAKFTESATKLLDAGRGAAISAMNAKVEALEQRARLSEVPAKGRDVLRGRRRDDEESDVYDDDAEDDEVRGRDMDDEDEDRGRYLDDDEGDDDEGDEDEGDEDEGDEEEPEDDEPEDDEAEDDRAARGRSGSRPVRSGQGGGARREPAVRRTRREGR